MLTRILGGITFLAVLMVGGHSAAAVGAIVNITISPSTVSVAAGSTQAFTVEGVDANGAKADLTTNSVFTTTDPRGTVKTNVFTGGKTGERVVTANYNNLTASATITVTPGTIADLTVNPNSGPERLSNGETLIFRAEAFDSFDNVVKDFTVSWSVEEKIGTMTSAEKNTATFTATKEGNGRVVARSGDESASVDVAVEKAPLASNANVNASTTIQNVNQSTNASTTTNTNAPTLITEETATNTQPETTTTTKPCTPRQRSSWIWFYVGYVVLLALSVYPIRKSRVSWWWIGPLALTVLALWFYFQYRCYPVFPALPYLIILAGIIAASWYNWQRTEPTKL